MDTSIRRAVIIDGAIKEKKFHPDTAEVLSVSAFIELERVRRGEKNIPRFTAQLIEQCIRTNDPELWKAANDDIDTKDFDAPAANSVFVQQDILPAMFIGCITSAKNTEHLVDMLNVLFELAPSLTETTSLALSNAISSQWKALTNVLIGLVEPTTRQLKDGVFIVMARFVDAVNIHEDAIVSVIKEIIKNRKYELLSIFARVKSNIYAGLLPDLLAVAKNASATNRYALVSLIAKIAAENEDIDEDIMPTVNIILEKSIQDKYADVRLLKALAFLINKFSPDPIMKKFATVMLWQIAS